MPVTPLPQKKKAPSRPPEENPPHVLIDAIRRALKAGVDPARVVSILDMAHKATGVKQAPVWRSCAEALDEYAAEAAQPG